MTAGGAVVQIGETIDGKYQIVRLLGEGGMGCVFEGLNMAIGRRVAIKVLHAPVADNATMQQRFQLEAQAAARIGSHHIVDVLDLGELPSGNRFMVMEYLEGESLDRRLVRPMAPEEIFPIIIQLLDGLADAHAAGIVHRDMKPENVFLVREKKKQTDFVKILDFGISKFRAADGTNSNLTHTGAVLGTPYYMSPEQVQGETNIDERTDLYSVGVILYQALAGRVPFTAESVNKLMFKIALEDAPPLEQLSASIDPQVAAIVRTAVTRDRQYRYQTAEQFAGALRQWLDGRVSYPYLPAYATGPSPVGYPAGNTVLGAPAAATGGASQSGISGIAAQTPPPGVMTASPATWDIRQVPRSSSASKVVAAIIGVVACFVVAAAVLYFGLSRPSDPAASAEADGGEVVDTTTAEPVAEAESATSSAAPVDSVATAEPSASASTAPPSPTRVAAKPTPTPKPTKPATKPTPTGITVGGRPIHDLD